MMNISWQRPLSSFTGGHEDTSNEIKELKSFLLSEMKERDHDIFVLREELRSCKRSLSALEEKINRVGKQQDSLGARITSMESSVSPHQYRHSGTYYSEDISDIEEPAEKFSRQPVSYDECQGWIPSHSAEGDYLYPTEAPYDPLWTSSWPTAEKRTNPCDAVDDNAFDAFAPLAGIRPQAIVPIDEKTRDEMLSTHEVALYGDTAFSCEQHQSVGASTTSSSGSRDFVAYVTRMSPILEALDEDERVKRDWSEVHCTGDNKQSPPLLLQQMHQQDERHKSAGDTAIAATGTTEAADQYGGDTIKAALHNVKVNEAEDVEDHFAADYSERVTELAAPAAADVIQTVETEGFSEGDKEEKHSGQEKEVVTYAPSTMSEFAASGATCEDLTSSVWANHAPHS